MGLTKKLDVAWSIVEGYLVAEPAERMPGAVADVVAAADVVTAAAVVAAAAVGGAAAVAKRIFVVVVEAREYAIDSKSENAQK